MEHDYDPDEDEQAIVLGDGKNNHLSRTFCDDTVN